MREKIEEVADYHAIDPDWIEAVVRIESNYATKPKPRWERHLQEHSYGLGQFLPSTVLWMLDTPSRFLFPRRIYSRLDAARHASLQRGEKALNEALHEEDIGLYLIGAYLKYLLSRYNGNIVKAVAAYNAGSARYTTQGVFVNQWHVDKFLSALTKIKGSRETTSPSDDVPAASSTRSGDS
jgi:hypothetical protein